MVTDKVCQRWTQSDRALTRNPSAQAPISRNISYLCSPLSRRGCTYTQLCLIGQLLVSWAGQPLSSSCPSLFNPTPKSPTNLTTINTNYRSNTNLWSLCKPDVDIQTEISTSRPTCSFCCVSFCHSHSDAGVSPILHQFIIYLFIYLWGEPWCLVLTEHFIHPIHILFRSTHTLWLSTDRIVLYYLVSQ